MVLFVLLLIASGALYGAMMLLTVPVLLAEAGGLRPFDFRPFGYGYADVQTYLNALSEEGVATYLGLQQQLDLLFPLVLSAMFVVGFRRFLAPAFGIPMTVVAVIAASADYAENAMVARILTAPVTEGEVALASMLTVTKSVSVALCMVVMLVIAWRALARRKGWGGK